MYHDSMPRAKHIHPNAARLGAIVQRLRLARGWTLTKCAQRTGMNATYLSILEKGGNMPSVQTLFELADVFNVRPSELIREVEEAHTTASWKTSPSGGTDDES
jgi:transcriptional regulator with XRE-family HTH domain